MSQRFSQIVAEALASGVPATRISQIVAEALAAGVPPARISQIVAEVLAGGDGAEVRVSQIVAEALVGGHASGNLRVSQVIVEAFIPYIEVFMPLIYPDLPGLGYSVHWRPKGFNMPTVNLETGGRLDIGWSDSPLHEFELTYDFLRGEGFGVGSTEFKTMMGFFLALNGNLGRFLFPNPYDRSVTNQFIATTDGVEHQWILQRTFGIGEYSGTEPVGYVDVTSPFAAYLDGVKLDPSTYTVDTTDPVSQQIIINSGTPTLGQKLTVDMSYFYYCNFPDGTLDFEAFMNNLWMLKSAKFMSLRASN